MEPTYTPKLAPYLVAENAPGLIRFIEEGIGGKLSFEMKDDKGNVGHAEVRVADGLLMIAERPEGQASVTAMLHLYVEDAKAAHARAVRSGALSVREASDAPEGGVRGGVRDRWGNEWWFTTPGKSP